MPLSTYHAGERAVQDRAGVSAVAARSARAIRPTLPDAARAFLEEQTFVVLGWTDRRQRVWCSLPVGPPGFLHAPDEQTVAIDVAPTSGDPPASLVDGDHVGLLAIDPPSRRRMRTNGIATRNGGWVHVAVEQVVANCPRYITVRVPDEQTPDGTHGDKSETTQLKSEATQLSEAHRALITSADTFFVATALPERGPADASHRGGNPGFVEVSDANTITWPDYRGNSMFLTLGNLAVNPRAGLLFVDWTACAVLQITGSATVDWDPGAAALRPGAERLVRFDVETVLTHTVPGMMRRRLVELSRANPPVNVADHG